MTRKDYIVSYNGKKIANCRSNEQAVEFAMFMLEKPSRMGMPNDIKAKDIQITETDTQIAEPVFRLEKIFEPAHYEDITETSDWEFKRANYTETVEKRFIPARVRIELYADDELVERDVRVMRDERPMTAEELEEYGLDKVYGIYTYEE